jgi:hypothetical protein
MYSKYLIQHKNINFTTQIEKSLSDKQKILLYLKFYSKSKVINFVEFSKVFDVKYRSYENNINSLFDEKIMKPYRFMGVLTVQTILFVGILGHQNV